jgi:cold shock protein
MTLTGKLVTSLVVAAIASTTATLLQGSPFPNLTLLACFCAATLATAGLTSLPAGPAHATGDRRHPAEHTIEHDPDLPREQGKVKWFNVSKGFGFIVKDDGDEVFVHFRSIRGEGRRALRDGQRVAFVVADSAKGPQAEDVVALEP